MKYTISSNGYYYKEYKNGKKVKVSKKTFNKYNKNILQKGGVVGYYQVTTPDGKVVWFKQDIIQSIAIDSLIGFGKITTNEPKLVITNYSKGVGKIVKCLVFIYLKTLFNNNELVEIANMEHASYPPLIQYLCNKGVEFTTNLSNIDLLSNTDIHVNQNCSHVYFLVFMDEKKIGKIPRNRNNDIDYSRMLTYCTKYLRYNIESFLITFKDVLPKLENRGGKKVRVCKNTFDKHNKNILQKRGHVGYYQVTKPDGKIVWFKSSIIEKLAIDNPRELGNINSHVVSCSSKQPKLMLIQHKDGEVCPVIRFCKDTITDIEDPLLIEYIKENGPGMEVARLFKNEINKPIISDNYLKTYLLKNDTELDNYLYYVMYMQKYTSLQHGDKLGALPIKPNGNIDYVKLSILPFGNMEEYCRGYINVGMDIEDFFNKFKNVLPPLDRESYEKYRELYPWLRDYITKSLGKK